MKPSKRRLTAALAATLAVAMGLGVAQLAQSQGGEGTVFIPGASNGPIRNSGQPTHPAHTPLPPTPETSTPTQPTEPAHPTDPAHPTEPAHPTATPAHLPACECPWPPEKYSLDSVVMSLERTPCFGACPEYVVEVHGDGRVLYEGRRFVAVEGPQEGRISVAEVQSLVEAFYAARFYDMRPRYDARTYPCFRPSGEVEACSEYVTDLPSQIVSFSADTYVKTVDDYWDAPEALRLLEDKIDEVAGTEKWVRGPTPTP